MRKNILKFVPVRYLLLAAFAVLFIGLIYTQIAQYKQYQRLTNRYSTITGSSVEKLSLLINLRKGSDYVQTNVLHLLLISDPAELAATRKKIQQEVERNDTNMREFQQLIMANGKEEKELFDSLVFYRQQNNAVRKLLLNKVAAGQINQARQFYLDSQHYSYEHLQYANTLLAGFVKDSANHQKFLLNTIIAEDSRQTLTINAIIIFTLIVMGIAVFRTLQKLREDHLQIAESEAKYRFLAEHTNEIINRCDASGKITFANQAFKDKLGYDDADIARLTIPEILDEDSIHTYYPDPRPEVEGTILKNIQKTYKTKFGQKLYVEGSIIIDYKNRKCVSAEAFFNDITEKKLLEQKLIASEAKYRSLFELSPIPMLVYDANSLQILQVNPLAIQHYGYSEKEWQAKKIIDIIHEEYLPDALQVIEQVQYHPLPYEGYMQHITQNGTIIDVEMRGVPFEYEGKPARLVTVLDVTERNQMENRLSKAILDTQEQERFQISAELHDNVNQILTGAVFTLGILKKSEMDSSRKEAVETTNKYISMAIEAIRKISHRLAPPSFNLVDFSDSIRMLLNSMNIDKQYRIEFACNISPETKMKEDMMLNIYRILQEQLSNIHKYAAATLIEVSLNVADGRAKLYIADNGKGFDMHTPRTGIGLRNIERRAALFSGYCHIDSTPGNGCCVKVLLPV
jgi:PAS domain S-box-containing protein